MIRLIADQWGEAIPSLPGQTPWNSSAGSLKEQVIRACQDFFYGKILPVAVIIEIGF
jgi:hypothetical protein